MTPQDRAALDEYRQHRLVPGGYVRPPAVPEQVATIDARRALVRDRTNNNYFLAERRPSGSVQYRQLDRTPEIVIRGRVPTGRPTDVERGLARPPAPAPARPPVAQAQAPTPLPTTRTDVPSQGAGRRLDAPGTGPRPRPSPPPSRARAPRAPGSRVPRAPPAPPPPPLQGRPRRGSPPSPREAHPAQHYAQQLADLERRIEALREGVRETAPRREAPREEERPRFDPRDRSTLPLGARPEALLTRQGRSSRTARAQDLERGLALGQIRDLRRLYEELYWAVNPPHIPSSEELWEEMNQLVTGELGTAQAWLYQRREDAERLRRALEFGDQLRSSPGLALLYGGARLAGWSHDDAQSLATHPGYVIAKRLLGLIPGLDEQTVEDVAISVDVITRLVGLAMQAGSPRGRGSTRGTTRPGTGRPRTRSRATTTRAPTTTTTPTTTTRPTTPRRSSTVTRRAARATERRGTRPAPADAETSPQPPAPPPPPPPARTVSTPPNPISTGWRQRASEQLRMTANTLLRMARETRAPRPRRGRGAVSERQWQRERREARGAARVIDEVLDRDLNDASLSRQAWEALARMPVRTWLPLLRRMRRLRGRYLNGRRGSTTPIGEYRRRLREGELRGAFVEALVGETVRARARQSANAILRRLGPGWRLRQWSRLRSPRRMGPDSEEARPGQLYVRDAQGRRVPLGELTDGAYIVERTGPPVAGEPNAYIVAIGEIKSHGVRNRVFGARGQFARDRARIGEQDTLISTGGTPGTAGDLSRQSGRRTIRYRPDEIAIHPDAVYVLGTPRGSLPSSQQLARTRGLLGADVVHVEGPMTQAEVDTVVNAFMRATTRTTAHVSPGRTREALEATEPYFGPVSDAAEP